MTIGIYALYWEDQDLIYIGLSEDVEGRYRDHLRLCRGNKHTNYKVQDAFYKYGSPNLVIIEKCLISELNDKEIYWTREFNSINDGLNIVEAGLVGWGTLSNSSKYSKRQILKVFSLLYKSTLSHKCISIKSKVSASLPQDIVLGKSHLWLREAYPKQYSLMKENRAERIPSNNGALFQNRGIKLPTIVSPEGIIYNEISNLTEFCKTIPLFSINIKNSMKGLSKVILGERNQYKGWTLQQI